MPAQQYRVVLDTNQIISAGSKWIDGTCEIGTDNISRRVLICVACSHNGLYSVDMFREYVKKLAEKHHDNDCIVNDRIVKLMALIMGAFNIVQVATRTAPIHPRDLDDEIFLLCAIDGNADYLVSDDGDLLVLAPDYSKPLIGKSQDLAMVLGA
jgi:putative PIN family toxin of toxin-antitoxin system